MTEEQVLLRLRAAVNSAGGQRQFAEQHDLHPSYVSDVLRGKRALADRILATIGVVRETVYREKEQE